MSAALSLFLKAFELAHVHPLAGHMGQTKTLESLKRFFFWPGMYKWIISLIADCQNCQTNKHKRHDQSQAELQPWTETVPFPFHTVHIDHKGPLNPVSNGYKHCLVIVDSFSRFIQIYPVENTSANGTIDAMEKFILSFGIPQKLVYDRGTAFINSEFTNWAKELGITLAPRTAYSPWTNGKVEIQNKHLGRYLRSFIRNNGTNWAKLAPQFAFAHNTSVNYSTGLTPYEIVFGSKPQIPLSLKLGLLRNNERNCESTFCHGLPEHQHSKQFLQNETLDNLLIPKLSKLALDRENAFKRVYSKTYRKTREFLDRSAELRNKHKLAKPLDIGQKVLLENHFIDLTKSKKLSELRSGPYTVISRITNVTYKIQLDSNPDTTKVVHRNHLIEYFPITGVLPELVTNYVPSQKMKDLTFYQNLAKQQQMPELQPSPQYEMTPVLEPIRPNANILPDIPNRTQIPNYADIPNFGDDLNEFPWFMSPASLQAENRSDGTLTPVGEKTPTNRSMPGSPETPVAKFRTLPPTPVKTIIPKIKKTNC